MATSIITNETVYCIQKSNLSDFKKTINKVYHPYISKVEVLEEKISKTSKTSSKESKDPKIHVVVESIANYDFIHMMTRLEPLENKRPRLNDRQKYYLTIMKLLIDCRCEADTLQYSFNISETDEVKFEEIFPILLSDNRVISYLILPEQNKFFVGVKDEENPKNLFIIELSTNKIKDSSCPKFDLIEGFSCPIGSTSWDCLNPYFEEWRENDYEDEMFSVVEY